MDGPDCKINHSARPRSGLSQTAPDEANDARAWTNADADDDDRGGLKQRKFDANKRIVQ